mmetsp:Transcript_99990/g.214209  ORF Transcript_99990/g.214209 Transcript_99990/m.214209 type:complete len:421 (+) Transcript_99990:73-1335(+)
MSYSLNVQPLPPAVIKPGAVNQLGQYIKSFGGQSAFLVTDKGLTKAGVTARITSIFEKAKLPYFVFDEVVANPTAELIDHGAQRLKEFGPEPVVVTLGGGSSMDAGKAIAVLAKQEGSPSIVEYCFSPEFDEQKLSVNLATLAPKKAPQGGFKIIAVPTTSGTASETNGASVITVSSTSEHRKLIFANGSALAAQLVLDAELCTKVPAYPTATCGMDVLTHALEAFTSGRQNPYADGIAYGAIKLVAENLRAVLKDPENIELRQNMHVASHMAGIAFGLAPLGIVHAMGHPLSAMYNQAHGQTLATMLPALIKFNMPARADKYAEVAKIFGVHDKSKSIEDNAEATRQAIIQLSKDVGTARSIESYANGTFEKDLSKLTKQAMTDVCMLTTARMPKFREVEALYREAFSNSTVYTISAKL